MSQTIFSEEDIKNRHISPPPPLRASPCRGGNFSISPSLAGRASVRSGGEMGRG